MKNGISRYARTLLIATLLTMCVTSSAQYLQSDPIGINGGLNLYGYAGQNPVNNVDPYGLAYFARRALQGLPWLGSASDNPLDNMCHTALSHIQLFFEDGKSPSNLGFFEDGTLKAEPNNLGYHSESVHYNDCIMRKAVARVHLMPYHLIGNNCQTWASQVKVEYSRLENDLSVQADCKCNK